MCVPCSPGDPGARKEEGKKGNGKKQLHSCTITCMCVPCGSGEPGWRPQVPLGEEEGAGGHGPLCRCEPGEGVLKAQCKSHLFMDF
eukprot:scaffold132025_cov17-Tisochrysis_lutea.AAC.1